MLRTLSLTLGLTAAIIHLAASPMSAAEADASTTHSAAAGSHQPAAAPPAAATPSIADQRDAYQRQLTEVQQQLRMLAQREQQLLGAITALGQYAPAPTPELEAALMAPRMPTLPPHGPQTGDQLGVDFTATGFRVSVNGTELRAVHGITFDMRAGDLVVTLHGAVPSLPAQHGYFVAAADMADFLRWRMERIR